MPKHPLTKAEGYSLAAVLLIGAAAGAIWAALDEVANARRELRTARLNLAAARDDYETVSHQRNLLRDANGRLGAQLDEIRKAAGRPHHG